MNNVTISGLLNAAEKTDFGMKGVFESTKGLKFFVKTNWDSEFAKELVTASEAKRPVTISGELRMGDYAYPLIEKVTPADQVSVVGFLGREAELKYSSTGKPYTDFSVGINYGWGEDKEVVFLNCRIWQNNDSEKGPAMRMANKGAKGTRVHLVGFLEQYLDKEDRVRTTMTVTDFQIISGSKKSENGSNGDKNDPWAASDPKASNGNAAKSGKDKPITF